MYSLVLYASQCEHDDEAHLDSLGMMVSLKGRISAYCADVQPVVTGRGATTFIFRGLPGPQWVFYI